MYIRFNTILDITQFIIEFGTDRTRFAILANDIAFLVFQIVNTLNDINKTGAFEKMSERELMEKLGVKEEEKEENIEVQAQEQEEEEEELITN